MQYFIKLYFSQMPFLYGEVICKMFFFEKLIWTYILISIFACEIIQANKLAWTQSNCTPFLLCFKRISKQAFSDRKIGARDKFVEHYIYICKLRCDEHIFTYGIWYTKLNFSKYLMCVARTARSLSLTYPAAINSCWRRMQEVARTITWKHQ